MALVTTVAGAYTGVYKGYNIGLLQSGGFKLTWVQKGKRIDQTKSYGETLINGIYTGGDFTISYVMMEWPVNLATAPKMDGTWTWGQASAIRIWSPMLGTVGRSWNSNVQPLVLTAVANTPAAQASTPASLTASNTIPTNRPTSIQLDSTNRILPIELHLLPYQNAGNNVWFTVT